MINITDYEYFIEMLKNVDYPYVEIKNCEFDGCVYNYVGVEDTEDETIITGFEFNQKGTLHRIYSADGVFSLGAFHNELKESQIDPNESYIDKTLRHIQDSETVDEQKNILRQFYFDITFNDKIRKEFENHYFM